MKRILSFLLALIMILSISVVSASAEDRKFPQIVHNRLAQHDDTDVLSVWIEVYTGIKVMNKWEYFWRNDINMSRFEKDNEYANAAYEEYKDYCAETEKQIENKFRDFYYNEFGAVEDAYAVFNGAAGTIGTRLTVAEIKRLESYDKVLGVNILRTGGYDASFNAQPVEFATEIYNTEYLGNTSDEAVAVEYYFGMDGLYGLFRGGQVQSQEYSEEIIDDLLIIGSKYTHSDDNPTGLFAVTESGVIRTLKEGFDLNVLHIDQVAMTLPHVYVIGDADYDWKLTIKDATMIQKILAGLKDYEDVVCVSRPEDKDRDGRVTIKDATAIQKQIAGLGF